MNDRLRARLEAHLDAAREEPPMQDDGELPHYLYHQGFPRYVEAWPEPSPAREQADMAREERDWIRAV